MRIIGLTGGIAAGKSLVARRLAELGAELVDADRLARDAVAPGSPGLAALVEAFGPGILREDGSLDRPGLGARVFGHPERLAVLNGIVHPEVRRLAAEAFAGIRARSPDAIAVYDVPLLAESSPETRDGMERILVVTAGEPERVRRMVEDRGMSEAEARSRIASQASDADRLAIATDVVDNSGTVAETIAQVDAFWDRLSRSRSDR